MNKELIEAMDILEKEKEISKETLFEAIENSLLTACRNHFGKADNVTVSMNRETGDFKVVAEKEVVATPEEVEDDCLQIALEDALKYNKKAEVGGTVSVEIKSKEFGRIEMCIRDRKESMRSFPSRKENTHRRKAERKNRLKRNCLSKQPVISKK